MKLKREYKGIVVYKGKEPVYFIQYNEFFGIWDLYEVNKIHGNLTKRLIDSDKYHTSFRQAYREAKRLG